MTDARIYAQRAEISVLGTISDLVLYAQAAEVAVLGTTSAMRLYAQQTEVAVSINTLFSESDPTSPAAMLLL